MSSIQNYRATFGSAERECSFCGDKLYQHGGMWSTRDGDIFCCHRCATGNLARFMADCVAVHGSGERADADARAALEKATASFWTAFSSRLASMLRKQEVRS